ncbi:hypothetical protein T11_10854 [Trichinella zimbabwensis]|uniref:Uncharacterized protein n=1 Tax=Trichinella zimbabwensis TaxID=268475 RepID=A0A0V1GVW3_9BILA|nr:hypothetical protein T11_10854 [Trichinella zimbabwensis]
MCSSILRTRFIGYGIQGLRAFILDSITSCSLQSRQRRSTPGGNGVSQSIPVVHRDWNSTFIWPVNGAI